MTINNPKKIVQYTILILVILGASFYFLNEFYLSKLEDRVNVDEIFEFKVVRQDLTQEQIDVYKDKFEINVAQTKDSEDNFNLSSLNSLAMIKKILHDFEGARQVWEYISFKSPKNSLSFFNLGILYMDDLKDNKKAEQNLLTALENSAGERGNEQYYITIVNFYTYYYPEKKYKIEDILLEALASEEYKDNVNILIQLANYYQTKNQIEKAIEYWQKALVLDPENEAIKLEIENLK